MVIAGIFFSGCINKVDNIGKDNNVSEGDEQLHNTSYDNNTYKNNSGKLDILMKLDKTNFSKEENIKITLILKNNVKYPIDLKNSDKGIFTIEVFNISSNTSFLIYLKGTKNVSIKHGDYLTQNITWNQSYKIGNEDVKLGSGKYRLTAYLKTTTIYQDSKGGYYQFKSGMLRTNPLTITID